MEPHNRPGHTPELRPKWCRLGCWKSYSRLLAMPRVHIDNDLNMDSYCHETSHLVCHLVPVFLHYNLHNRPHWTDTFLQPLHKHHTDLYRNGCTACAL